MSFSIRISQNQFLIVYYLIERMSSTPKRLHLILKMLCFAFAIQLVSANIAALPRNFSPTNKSTTTAQKNEYLLGLVNKVRKQPPPLYLDTTLNQLALAHSEDMLRRNFFNHVNPDGKSPSDRAREKGFLYGVGQNIAYIWGFNLTELHVNLMNSPPHYSNTIKQIWTRVGFGVAYNQTHTYLTVVFSSRDFTKNPFKAEQKKALLTNLKKSIEGTNKFTRKPAFWPELSAQIQNYQRGTQQQNIFTHLFSKNYKYRSISYRYTLNQWSKQLFDTVKSQFEGVSNGSSTYARYGIGIQVDKTGMVSIFVVYITPR